MEALFWCSAKVKLVLFHESDANGAMLGRRHCRCSCRIQLHYGQTLAGVDFERQRATFADDGGSRGGAVAPYDLLVGCDGRNSRVRQELERVEPGMAHSMRVAPRSYKGFYGLPPVGETPPLQG